MISSGKSPVSKPLATTVDRLAESLPERAHLNRRQHGEENPDEDAGALRRPVVRHDPHDERRAAHPRHARHEAGRRLFW